MNENGPWSRIMGHYHPGFFFWGGGLSFHGLQWTVAASFFGHTCRLGVDCWARGHWMDVHLHTWKPGWFGKLYSRDFAPCAYMSVRWTWFKKATNMRTYLGKWCNRDCGQWKDSPQTPSCLDTCSCHSTTKWWSVFFNLLCKMTFWPLFTIHHSQSSDYFIDTMRPSKSISEDLLNCLVTHC